MIWPCFRLNSLANFAGRILILSQREKMAQRQPLHRKCFFKDEEVVAEVVPDKLVTTTFEIYHRGRHQAM